MTRWRGRFGWMMCALTLLACGGTEAEVAYEGDEPGECTDGADNDQDQAFDCDDPGCAGAPSCSVAPVEDAVAATDVTPEPDVSEPDVSEPEPDTTEPEDALETDAGPDVEPEPEPIPVDPANPCPPLADAEGPVVQISPSQIDDLRLQLATAEEGTTFTLADGVYALDGQALWVSVPGTTLRAASGDADAVILDGEGDTETAIHVAASHVTLADMTIRDVSTHGVRVQPDPGQDGLSHVTLYRLRIIDARQRAVVVDRYNQSYVDEGVLACSHLTLTEEGRAQLTAACDIGGAELREAAGWTLRDNVVDGFWCEDATAAPALLAWKSSAATVVERNRIEDCARGIGLGESQTGVAGQRTHDEPECNTSAHIDHYGGVIRNNMIFVGGDEFVESGASFESGIHVWSGCQATVVHNTVVGLVKPYSSIEWRFDGTIGAQVLNNLVSHNLRERTWASAFQLGNLEEADETLFLSQDEGDLHLAPDVLGAINAGEDVAVGLADHDFDGELRLGVRDIGADERVE